MLKKLELFFLITTTIFKANCEVAVYGKCGGIDYTGSTVCDSSSICVYSNQFYSQCLPKPNDPNKVNEWGQCGGINYNGKKECQEWLTCVRDGDWYYQCKKIAKNTRKYISTTNYFTKKPTTTSLTKTSIATTSIYDKTSTILINLPIQNKFTKVKSSDSNENLESSFFNRENKCKVGIAYEKLDLVNFDNYDFISIKLANKSQNSIVEMLQQCKNKSKLPIFYMNLIEDQALNTWNLSDCNSPDLKNLCNFGGKYIRENIDELKLKYKEISGIIAKNYEKNKPILFCIEPNFRVYYEKVNEYSLSGEEASNIFVSFIQEIKSEIPNALISWYASPVLSIIELTKWWAYFSSLEINFVHRSVGETFPELIKIRLDDLALIYPSFEDLMKDLLNKQISSCVPKTYQIQYNESKSFAQSSQKAIIQTRTSSQRIFSSSELRVSTTKNLWANSNSDIEGTKESNSIKKSNAKYSTIRNKVNENKNNF
ncbi:unnamed protein product [Brachionus calyciflorus]|uniref:CBM1 domain-containing protein n=1 Tax=Brachionus calyciflorus TaxID=104777 RepID=A0A814LAG2_9BILA|nr:unnamed protein product [Brachionus calyciflorus]